MLNFARVDPRLLAEIDIVVTSLVERTGLSPAQILVVGAQCRDILHSALGHDFVLRATSDLDIGIAIADFEAAEQIDRNYARIGETGIRYLIDGFYVDVLPFGAIENPDGISHPIARGEELVVSGLRSVHASSETLTLASGHQVRVPSVAGYVALKLLSWLDRSAYGEDKDAKDLAVCAYWYRESQEVEDVLFTDAECYAKFAELEHDLVLAAAWYMGKAAAKLLPPVERDNLCVRFANASASALAAELRLPATAPADYKLDRRVQIVEQLVEGLNS